MKSPVICAFVIATIVQTHAGTISAGLSHGLLSARATLAAAPAAPAATLSAAAPFPAAPASPQYAAATLTALPSQLPAAVSSFSTLPAAAIAGPAITIGAPLAALSTNVIDTRALFGAHGAPLVLQAALPASLHSALYGAGLAGHVLPAHL